MTPDAMLTHLIRPTKAKNLPSLAGFFLPVVSAHQCEYLPYKSVITSIESFVTIICKVIHR